MPDLGKYAFEVLMAYGVSIAMLLVLVAISWRRATRVRAQWEKVKKNG